MPTMSINYTSVVLISYMLWIAFRRPFLMEVDPVDTNQRTKPFYPSSDPTMEDDVVIRLSFYRETTMA